MALSATSRERDDVRCQNRVDSLLSSKIDRSAAEGKPPEDSFSEGTLNFSCSAAKGDFLTKPRSGLVKRGAQRAGKPARKAGQAAPRAARRAVLLIAQR